MRGIEHDAMSVQVRVGDATDRPRGKMHELTIDQVAGHPLGVHAPFRTRVLASVSNSVIVSPHRVAERIQAIFDPWSACKARRGSSVH